MHPKILIFTTIEEVFEILPYKIFCLSYAPASICVSKKIKKYIYNNTFQCDPKLVPKKFASSAVDEKVNAIIEDIKYFTDIICRKESVIAFGTVNRVFVVQFGFIWCEGYTVKKNRPCYEVGQIEQGVR